MHLAAQSLHTLAHSDDSVMAVHRCYLSADGETTSVI
jgi:hypothetical protein